MKKILIFFVFLIFFTHSPLVKAMQLTNIKGRPIYGHLDASAGMNFQFTKGHFREILEHLSLAGYEVHYNNIGLQFGLGYNVYYALIGIIHPFIGAEANLRIPVYGNKLVDESNRGYEFSCNEWFNMHIRLGAKFNVYNNVSVLLYYLIGFNAGEHRTKLTTGTAKESATGISTGIGLSGLIKNRYIVGMEYLHKESKNVDIVKTDNLNLKFGVQFF